MGFNSKRIDRILSGRVEGEEKTTHETTHFANVAQILQLCQTFLLVIIDESGKSIWLVGIELDLTPTDLGGI